MVDNIAYRIQELEKKYATIDEKLDKIRTKDIPDINTEIGQLSSRINVLSLVNVGAIAAAVVITQILK